MEFKHGHWYLVNGKKYIFIGPGEEFLFQYSEPIYKFWEGRERLEIATPGSDNPEDVYLDEAEIEEVKDGKIEL